VLVIDTLRSLDPNMTIVLVSAFPERAFELVEMALRAGAVTCMLKPVTLGSVVNKLTEISPIKISSETTLAEIKWQTIQRTVAECVGNKTLAARRLGVPRQSLQRMLRAGPPFLRK